MASEDSSKNPLTSSRASLEDEDNDDLFVSTFESQPPPQKTGETTATTEAPASLPDEEMNIINLDDDEEDKTQTKKTEEVLEQAGKKPKLIKGVEENPSTPSSLHTQPPAPISFEVPEPELPTPPRPAGQSSFQASKQFQPPSQSAPPPLITPPPFASSSSTHGKINITLPEPRKQGEGISSFMVYTINTRTTLNFFRRQSMSVIRRFSDFLGLHDKLVAKHLHHGRIIPPPPEKNAVGTAKVKMNKDREDTSGVSDFVEKRRASLERYLQRIAEHPVLCADPDFREFLELDTELPRSTSTSALSGAGVKKMFSFLGETVNKLTYKMDETDLTLAANLQEIKWFSNTEKQLDNLEVQLNKISASVHSLLSHRKDLVISTSGLAKATAILGNMEENTSLSCALSQLSATQEKLEKIYAKQASSDFCYLYELVKDYIGLIASIKLVMQERVKCYNNVASVQDNLTKKREAKAKLELAQRSDKIPHVDEEVRELEGKLQLAKEEFDRISANIKSEFDRFELVRIHDFKENFVKYMEALLETQESLVETWENFVPESKSIVV